MKSIPWWSGYSIVAVLRFIATVLFLFVFFPASREAFIQTHLKSELESMAISLSMGVERALGMDDLSMIGDLNQIIAENPDVGNASIYLKAGSGYELIASFPLDESAESQAKPELVEGVETVRRDFSVGDDSGYVLINPGFERLREQALQQQTLSIVGFILFLILQSSSMWFIHKNVLQPSRQIARLTRKISQHCGLATADLPPDPNGDLKRTAEQLVSAEELLSCSKISSK